MIWLEAILWQQNVLLEMCLQQQILIEHQKRLSDLYPMPTSDLSIEFGNAEPPHDKR